MDSKRLEAFSDGVLAIIITIMVLEMKAPEDNDPETLIGLLPSFFSYLISFIYIGTYWNNHHHLFQVTGRVTGRVLWANLNLLFWLSLIPFATSWVGENHVDAVPVSFYGTVLLISGLSYTWLQQHIVKAHSKDAQLIHLLRNTKGTYSLLLYAIGIAMSYLSPWIGIACYVAVLGLWLIPDKTIEKKLNQ